MWFKLDGHIGALEGSVTVAYKGEPWKPEAMNRPNFSSFWIGLLASMNSKTLSATASDVVIPAWFVESCKFLHVDDFQCPHA